jgi:hypothetical protein
VAASVERAIRFLESAQDEFGEFRSTACDKNGLCQGDSTPFITTFVLYSLRDIRDPRVERMREGGLHFLREEMLPGGIWRYWTFRAPYVPILQPDLDDTVTAADILLEAGRLPVDNRELIRRNMDTRGRFLTWLLPTERFDEGHSLAFDFNPASRLRNLEGPPHLSYELDHTGRLFAWMIRNEFPNETDLAVNANVLLYLKEQIPSVCTYLNGAIAANEPSVYYLDAPSVYYMYGRAFIHGIRCIEPSGKIIVERLLKMQRPDGSWGTPQKTALALNALQDFDYRGEPLDHGTSELLSTQRNDGSWEDEYFFKESAFCKDCHYWRSAALTSALAVESLRKYRGY